MVVLTSTLLLPNPATLPTPRWERPDGPVLTWAVTAERVRRSQQGRHHDHRRCPRPRGHRLLELGAFRSIRPIDDGRVVELDQSLLLQILVREGRPSPLSLSDPLRRAAALTSPEPGTASAPSSRRPRRRPATAGASVAPPPGCDSILRPPSASRIPLPESSDSTGAIDTRLPRAVPSSGAGPPRQPARPVSLLPRSASAARPSPSAAPCPAPPCRRNHTPRSTSTPFCLIHQLADLHNWWIHTKAFTRPRES